MNDVTKLAKAVKKIIDQITSNLPDLKDYVTIKRYEEDLPKKADKTEVEITDQATKQVIEEYINNAE